jgi:hypothetical protein
VGLRVGLDGGAGRPNHAVRVSKKATGSTIPPPGLLPRTASEMIVKLAEETAEESVQVNEGLMPGGIRHKWGGPCAGNSANRSADTSTDAGGVSRHLNLIPSSLYG